MKVPNKQELDIEFETFTKYVMQNPYSSLVNEATLASDNFLRFRPNL